MSYPLLTDGQRAAETRAEALRLEARALVADIRRAYPIRAPRIRVSAATDIVHEGCVYPAGQRCRGADRCQFPSRCARSTP